MSASDAFASPWRQRRLVARLARREIAARYRGSVLGPLWAIAMPLCVLAVYAFAFGAVFQSRLAQAQTNGIPFVLVLFAGLLLFQFFAEIVQSSPSLIRSNSAYVKQVVFPLEILPIVVSVVALFNAAITLLVLLVFHAFMLGLPKAGVLWLPVIVLPLALLAVGIAWIFAAMGVFLRDMTQVASLLCIALMFLSPIFYSLEAVPTRFRWLVELNPITTVVGQARRAIFEGQPPEMLPLLLCVVAALAVFVCGFSIFQRLRPAFVDVM